MHKPLKEIALYRQRLYGVSWLMASLCEPIAGKPIKKMAVLADFIRCHPWRSTLEPIEAVHIFFRKICAKAVLNLKPC